jgi:hypothetical protein
MEGEIVGRYEGGGNERREGTYQKSGGSISHHHGVGKLRAQFLPQCLTPATMGVLRAIKAELDPKNVFAARSIIILFFVFLCVFVYTCLVLFLSLFCL